VDGQSIAAFEERLEDNLYKVWNRMSSGTWFPPPVKAVEIPKAGGGTRTLGVPTIADRVAQTVAANRGLDRPGHPRVDGLLRPVPPLGAGPAARQDQPPRPEMDQAQIPAAAALPGHEARLERITTQTPGLLPHWRWVTSARY
jgi:hypothetical protein